ncbi:hypothetical protein BN7_4875 [Wickerhamomyces ciferrii]|uniref:Kinetochore-associated protein MTW1 n=1 Tax=Wickerhamomyces ciferrii (strain ATCC 14091 / BCRC 22168 / CBS 111 / JCM 3599 / NBRC 0793 / NRRL Y-1031 F-60-10) TaxID=1206466 RepID=K0KVZ7_WICCF|nr:uncharacterized protein BN7_4875 [Wickerhamomyces ciferrii]CCH45293.1 hypothetical protein BN7_4875 [Wickerhamomyces ciferrii]
MSAPDQHTTELLTEHLGFPPIALIDDIINAVNGIMYKCTTAVEDYLYSHQPTNSPEEIQNDIEHGTAKLETLLENTLDKNFDKFELYALRNILTIPSNLPIKLKHQKVIRENSEQKSKEIDVQIREVLKTIEIQLKLKKLLIIQIRKAKKILRLLKIYKQTLQFINQDSEIRKQLEPLDESIYFIMKLSNELFTKIEEIQNSPSIESNQSSERERYLGIESNKLLKTLEIVGDQNKIDKLLDGVNTDKIKELYNNIENQ